MVKILTNNVAQPRFYVDQPLSTGKSVNLDRAVSNHMISVLRHQENDQVVLFNGSGQEYLSRISTANKRQTEVEIISVSSPERESPLQIVLFQAVATGEKMDWIIQKATELGVLSIVPMITEFTQQKLKGDRLEKKLSHWEKIAISACEQCGRNILPQIAQPHTFEEAINAAQGEYLIMLSLANCTPLPHTIPANRIRLLVGPEGGFSTKEMELLDEQVLQLSLGPRILRTETAAIAGLTLLQHHWGDL